MSIATNSQQGIAVASGQDSYKVAVGQKQGSNGQISPGASWPMTNNYWAISEDNEYVLVAQSDGNLVYYRVIGDPPIGPGSFEGQALWASNTMDKANGGTFEFQAGGNLVVLNSSGSQVWQSKTGGNPAYLVLSPGGNGELVLYDLDSVWIQNKS